MSKKRIYVIAFLAFCLVSYQPAPAHAGFFLFNILQGIFNGGHKSTIQSAEAAANTTEKNKLRSEDVAAVQQYLIKANYLAGVPDGKYGPQTAKALKAFQKDSGLMPNGIVDDQTMKALKNIRTAKPQTKALSTPQPSSPPSYKPVPRTNDVPSYLYTIPVIATAYTRYDEGCGNYTYRGNYLRRGLAAVDPNIIPLGTRLYVPGYGEALADDIGGAIQGNRIDLAMETLDEAFNYGRREVTVYVLPKV